MGVPWSTFLCLSYPSWYSVAKTHRMPKVAGHVSPKGPLWGKRATNYWALLPQREMTYEDKAPYASTPACIYCVCVCIYFLGNAECAINKLHTFLTVSLFFMYACCELYEAMIKGRLEV